MAIVVLFALSVALRSGNIWERPLLSHNEDATGHVLATMKGMEAAPASIHKYLPIITLSQRPADRHIDNFANASIADEVGNHFYVSFPPMGFAVPAVIFRGLGIEVTLTHLKLFSALLGLLTAILFYLLSLRLMRGSAIEPATRPVVALCMSALMLLNSESLWIFGNVYWHHVLLEPLLVLALLLMARLLDRPSSGRGFLLAAVMFLACTVEWAAYLLAAGVTLVGLHRLYRKEAGAIPLLVAGVIAPLLALLFIVWHFSQVAGLQAYLDVLQSRPSEHGWRDYAAIQAIVAFAPLYLPLAILAYAVFRGRHKVGRLRDEGERQRRIFGAVAFCAAAGAAESLLLLKHTAKYTYGSLPLTTLFLIGLLYLLAWRGAAVRRLAWGTMLCIGAWFAIYFAQNPPPLPTTPFGRQFDNLSAIPQDAKAHEMVFTNLGSPLGVPLGRTGRNLVSFPNISLEVPLTEMQAYLSRTEAKHGKLFLFDSTPQSIPQVVWWPYTKSRVVGTSSERRYGPVAAIVSFDRDRITGVRVSRDQNARRFYEVWRARQQNPR